MVAMKRISVFFQSPFQLNFVILTAFIRLTSMIAFTVDVQLLGSAGRLYIYILYIYIHYVGYIYTIFYSTKL